MEQLCFCSAAFGNWGIVRLGTLVPESHMLFACPYSCGRHNSIGAIKHGYRDKISYLFIDERDLAMGGIDQDITDAVETILRSIRPRPKVLLIYFSCVLYMSGFDWDALISELSETYPDVQFRACMMNPVAGDRAKPPVPAMVQTLCTLWERSLETRNTVNLLGCYSALSDDCELSEVLEQCGSLKLLHFSDMDTYDEYLRMGQSKYNLVVRPEGLLAAKAMESEKPFRFVPVSYDLKTIGMQYESIFEMLGKRCDMSPYRAHAEEEIRKTVDAIGLRPIAVGSSAVNCPFSLSLALIEYGFAVTDVFYESIPGYEQEAASNLQRRGTVRFHNVHEPAYVEQIGKVGNADIAIGYSAGYYSGAKHIVDLMIDEGMFGYGAVCRLMRMMREASCSNATLESMIDAYGLII